MHHTLLHAAVHVPLVAFLGHVGHILVRSRTLPLLLVCDASHAGIVQESLALGLRHHLPHPVAQLVEAGIGLPAVLVRLRPEQAAQTLVTHHLVQVGAHGHPRVAHMRGVHAHLAGRRVIPGLSVLRTFLPVFLHFPAGLGVGYILRPRYHAHGHTEDAFHLSRHSTRHPFSPRQLHVTRTFGTLRKLHAGSTVFLRCLCRSLSRASLSSFRLLRCHRNPTPGRFLPGAVFRLSLLRFLNVLAMPQIHTVTHTVKERKYIQAATRIVLAHHLMSKVYGLAHGNTFIHVIAKTAAGKIRIVGILIIALPVSLQSSQTVYRLLQIMPGNGFPLRRRQCGLHAIRNLIFSIFSAILLDVYCRFFLRLRTSSILARNLASATASAINAILLNALCFSPLHG